MYILINKNTNKIMNISKKGFTSYSDNLILAEVETIPENYDYLIAENIREIISEEGFIDHITCDLVAKFKTVNVRQNTLKEIKELKQKLSDTDYQAIKYAEGWLTEEDYLPIKIQRQEWRNRINELENL